MTGFAAAFQRAIQDAEKFLPGALHPQSNAGSNSLVGVISTPFRGRTYNVPVAIDFYWDRYPMEQPVARVCPTQSMVIVPSPLFCASTGTVRWGLYSWDGNFYSWLCGLQEFFSRNFPLRARPPQQQSSQMQLPQCQPLPPSQRTVPDVVPLDEEQGTATPVAATAATSGTRPVENTAECVICCDAPAKFAFVPCGHVALCRSCRPLWPSDRPCPVCRTVVTQLIEIFM